MFKPATKEKCKLRMAITGPSGSGKTYTALTIADGLGQQIALIDTEHGSASKYSDRFKFDTVILTDKSLGSYIKCIKEAERAGYDVLIIDSLSHAWNSLLEKIETLTNSKYKGNSFRAWGEGTPLQTKFIEALLESDIHIISTMRSKTEYVLEDVKGRSVPKKIGTTPIQGKDIEYEFDILMEMDWAHNGLVTKDRTGKFQDMLIETPGKDFGLELLEWCNDGIEPTRRTEEIVSKTITAKVDDVLPNDKGKKTKETVEVKEKDTEVYNGFCDQIAGADTVDKLNMISELVKMSQLDKTSKVALYNQFIDRKKYIESFVFKYTEEERIGIASEIIKMCADSSLGVEYPSKYIREHFKVKTLDEVNDAQLKKMYQDIELMINPDCLGVGEQG